MASQGVRGESFLGSRKLKVGDGKGSAKGGFAYGELRDPREAERLPDEGEDLGSFGAGRGSAVRAEWRIVCKLLIDRNLGVQEVRAGPSDLGSFGAGKDGGRGVRSTVWAARCFAERQRS